MAAYIKVGDVDPRRTVADHLIRNVMQEAIEYFEKQKDTCGTHGSQSARLIAMHFRAYADMIDEFSATIEMTEEIEHEEEKQALELRQKYHFQDQNIEEA